MRKNAGGPVTIRLGLWASRYLDPRSRFALLLPPRRRRDSLSRVTSRAARRLPRVTIHAAASIFGLAFSLAGCQTPTVVKDRIVEIKVPVAVQPIKPDQVPAVPKPLGPRPQSLSAAADLLLAKHCEFVAYALKADPLLRLSAGLTQQALAQFPECEGH